MRNRITERDLSRIVKRVIREDEEGGGQCNENNFAIMRMFILKDNEELTLTYNKPSNGYVTVSTDSPNTTSFPCVCRREELLPYIK